MGLKKLKTAYPDIKLLYEIVGENRDMCFLGIETPNGIEGVNVAPERLYAYGISPKQILSSMHQLRDSVSDKIFLGMTPFLFPDMRPAKSEFLAVLSEGQYNKAEQETNLDILYKSSMLRKFSPEVNNFADFIVDTRLSSDIIFWPEEEDVLRMMSVYSTIGEQTEVLLKHCDASKMLLLLDAYFYYQHLINSYKDDSINDFKIAVQITQLAGNKDRAILKLKNSKKNYSCKLGIMTPFTENGISDYVKYGSLAGNNFFNEAIAIMAAEGKQFDGEFIPYEYVDSVSFRDGSSWTNPL